MELRDALKDIEGITTPVVADFTRIDARGDYSFADDEDGIVAAISAAVSGDRPALVTRPLALSSFTITSCMTPMLPDANFNAYGLALRDSVTGRIHVLGEGSDFGPKYIEQRWTTITAWSATPQTLTGISYHGRVWLRMVSDGTALHLERSRNGRTWTRVLSTTRTAWCANPDQVGFWVHSQSGAAGQVQLHHLAIA